MWSETRGGRIEKPNEYAKGLLTYETTIIITILCNTDLIQHENYINNCESYNNNFTNWLLILFSASNLIGQQLSC